MLLLLTSAALLAAVGVAHWPFDHAAADVAGAQGAVKNLKGCTASNIPASDDLSSASVALPFAANFFGSTHTSLHVNNNGNVTFDAPFPGFRTASLVSTERAIVAPFFADVDTRGEGSGEVTYGSTTFDGRPAFCANWIDVGYYDSATDKLNSFQLLLVGRADEGPGDFDIMFNYNEVQWETGDANGGTNGLGGFSARAGFSNGTDAQLELPGSGIPGSFLDTNAETGLARTSRESDEAGRHLFQIRGGFPVGFLTPTPTTTHTVTATPTRTPTVPGAPTPTRTPTVPGGFAPGDVNKNGSVNSIDASIVLQYVAGFLGSINATADVNEDGQVTSVDATLILQYVAGLIDNLPV